MGKKKKGRSTQELMGIQNFTRYGLATNRGELLFFLVSPPISRCCPTRISKSKSGT